MPDFKVIEGSGPDKEEREKQEREAEKQRAREWAKDDVERTIREVAANMLRIIRGAGKPHEILMQMKSVIDAALKFREVNDSWPYDIIANELHLKSEDEEFREGERQGRYTSEQVDRWLADGEYDRILAEHTIQRGALQMIASALIGQNTQERAGESEFHDGLRSWAHNREERLQRRRDAEKAAAPPKKKLAQKKSRKKHRQESPSAL